MLRRARDGGGRSRRRVLLRAVMGLDKVCVEARNRGEQPRRFCNDAVEDCHSDGEVGSRQQRPPLPLGLSANARQLVVPAGGAHDHRTASRETGENVGRSRIRDSELDRHVGVAQRGAGHSLTRISRGSQLGNYATSALRRQLRQCAAHPAHPDEGHARLAHADTSIMKNAACSRCIAGFT